jgi:hypothetical protein
MLTILTHSGATRLGLIVCRRIHVATTVRTALPEHSDPDHEGYEIYFMESYFIHEALKTADA